MSFAVFNDFGGICMITSILKTQKCYQILQKGAFLSGKGYVEIYTVAVKRS